MTLFGFNKSVNNWTLTSNCSANFRQDRVVLRAKTGGPSAIFARRNLRPSSPGGDGIRWWVAEPAERCVAAVFVGRGSSPAELPSAVDRLCGSQGEPPGWSEKVYCCGKRLPRESKIFGAVFHIFALIFALCFSVLYRKTRWEIYLSDVQNSSYTMHLNKINW